MKSLRAEETEQSKLYRQIAQAEQFERELGNASNSYERAKIHEECERALNDGRPQNVIRRCRSALRRVEDNIRKLETRIDRLIQFAKRDIRRLIIDGNNLCYESSKFLNLDALQALVPILQKRFEVTIIFDASIRQKLRLINKEIESKFPENVRVHIVANRQKADETILATAGNDIHAFVLSNDRFADYPEKMVVKDDRLVRHEIVGRAVFIHELQVDVTF